MGSSDFDGVSVRQLVSQEYIGTARALPAVSAAATFKLVMDSATNIVVASVNGGAFFNLAGALGALIPLQTAYVNGNTVNMAAATTPVAITNTAAFGSVLLTIAQANVAENAATITTAGTGLGLLVTGGAGISSPGVGAASQRFGAGALTAGAGAVALGTGAVAAFANSIAIGTAATAAAADTFVAGSLTNPINIVRFQGLVWNVGVNPGTVHEFMDDQVTAVSAANEARLRYNQATGSLEVSVNTGAYGALVPGAGGTLQACYLLGAAIGITALGPVALTNAIANASPLLTVIQGAVAQNAVEITPNALALGLLVLTGGLGISAPGAGAGSETYGNAATAAGAAGTSVGNTAIAGFANSCSLGSGATSGAANAIAIGAGALAAFADSIAIGTLATPIAVNTFVAGSAANPINIVRFQSAGGGGFGTIYEFVADIGGAVSAGVGEARLRYRVAAGGLELSVGGGAYALIGGGVGTLQACYNAGAVIDLVGAVPVSITNSTSALASLLTVTQAAIANTAVVINAGGAGALGLQVINGRASFPMGGANSEAICLASAIGAATTSALAVGDTATIGAASHSSTVIGAGGTVGAALIRCTVLGAGSSVTGIGGTAIGAACTAAAGAVALGDTMTATAGTFVVGTVANVYFGNGITSAAPAGCNIHATGGNAGGVGGALLSISGGLAGGAGGANTGGNIDFFTGRTASENAPTLAVRLRATTGTISCPGAGGSSERFGLDATAAGASATAVGDKAIATGARSVAVGQGAACSVNATDGVSIGQNSASQSISGISIGGSLNAGCINSVLIGAQAGLSNGGAASDECVVIGFGALIGSLAPSTGSIAIGRGATVNGTYSIAIGHAAIAAFASSVVIGDTATATASNQIVFGSNPSPLTTMYIGNGVSDGVPATASIRSTSGFGAVNGASLQLLPGNGGAIGQRSGSLVIGTRAAGAGGFTNQIVAAGGTGTYGRLGLGVNVASEAFGSGVEIQGTSFGCTSILTTGDNPYTVLDTDFTVLYTTNGGVVSLLTPVGRRGRIICIKNRSLGGCTVVPVAGLIDGAANLVLATTNTGAILQSDGANWFRLANV